MSNVDIMKLGAMDSLSKMFRSRLSASYVNLKIDDFLLVMDRIITGETIVELANTVVPQMFDARKFERFVPVTYGEILEFFDIGKDIGRVVSMTMAMGLGNGQLDRTLSQEE